MGRGQIGHHPGHIRQAPPAGGPGALQKAPVGVDIGLVDGDILADQISHALHNPVDEAEEAGFAPLDPADPVHRFWASRSRQLFQGSLTRAMCTGRASFPIGKLK